MRTEDVCLPIFTTTTRSWPRQHPSKLCLNCSRTSSSMHDSSCCYLPIVISSYQDAMLRSPFEVPESTTSSPNRYGKCSTVTLNTCIDSGSQMNGMTYKTSRYLLLFYLILSPSFTMSHTCTLSASDPKVFNDAAMDCSTDRFITVQLGQCIYDI